MATTRSLSKTCIMASALAIEPHPLGHLRADFASAADEYFKYEKGAAALRDRYQFHANLQTGSFGKVSAALDLQNHCLVAVKALKKSVHGVKAMATHEVAIMKHLGYHANICQLVDHFETKKFIILVLEYAPCGDLYDAIHNKTSIGMSFQTDAKMFAELCKQLLDVIVYTHKKGVYHRDIKPENILLMRDGTIKLCDWGLATSSIECTDFNVGTEKYMAPEALCEEGNTSREWYDASKVDAWSIAITLLFTLFNKCPFRKALKSDPNYAAFLQNKNNFFDLYHNISTCSSHGIIDQLLLQRDLEGGLKYLIEMGIQKGYNIDQEYMISFTEDESRFVNYINNEALSMNNVPTASEDLFMFEDEDINNGEEVSSAATHASTNNNNTDYNHTSITYTGGDNANVDPIRIPLTKVPGGGSSYYDSSVSSFSFKNTLGGGNSLFDTYKPSYRY